MGQEWYERSTASYGFSTDALAWLNTAAIIRHDVIESNYKNPAHNIYRNIGKVYGEVFAKGDYPQALEYIAFGNYFLRPAEVCGESIIINGWDEEVRSFQQLAALEKQLQPALIVFVSKKAYESFVRVAQAQGATALLSKAKSVPHPNSAWWNRVITQYEGRTGKEELKNILYNFTP
ncbi:hypothetical protein [Capnocytophaga leadbetteri]|uniref:hypothetical protein n=1 Tax=Capnocytophaga leadbetteri TaxID=327575 RepID=UPI0028ECF17C|nr:hypothetical protein [Capnocytophaga leadbetteri]